MNFSEEIHKIPFVRLTIPLIVGILAQINYSINENFILIYFISTIILLTVTQVFINYIKNLKYTFANDLLKYILILIFGMLLVSISESKLKNLQNQDLSQGLIVAEITENPSLKKKSIKAIINVLAIKTMNGWELSTGKAVVYFEKDSSAFQLKYGDRILINASFSDIEGPKNPEEFNYKRYLSFHLISKQTYIKSGNWKMIDTNMGNPILRKTSSFRNKLINIYSNNNIKDQELAVLSALTLGYKDKLDTETKKTYSASGAMHLLAVSGLHIGIIYLILNYLLLLIPKSKNWKIFKVAFLLVALWFYALMTGLPSSAFRATVMFSLVIIGNALERKPNIYNSLAVSAFILLIINPYSITEVGFQLSYLAVIGIVFFQPKISSLFTAKNKIIQWLWDLISVSIAAQIATAPIAMYYFHQFPNYFLLTNIIVLPTAFLLIYFSLALFIFSLIEPLSLFIAKIEVYILKFLNGSVQFIESLPYSINSNINIDIIQLFSLYLATIFLAIFIVYKKSKMIKYILFCLIAFYMVKAQHYYKSLNQRVFIVYSIKNTSAVNLIYGTKNILFSNQMPDDKTLNFHIKNNWINMGLQNEEVITAEDLENPVKFTSVINKLKQNNIIYKNGIIYFQNLKILLLTDWFKQINMINKYPVDYIVLTNNGPIDIDYLISNFDFKKLIFDSSFPNYKLDKLLKKCKELDLPYHAVSKTGAFISEL